jgi:hypothetical protein
LEEIIHKNLVFGIFLEQFLAGERTGSEQYDE